MDSGRFKRRISNAKGLITLINQIFGIFLKIISLVYCQWDSSFKLDLIWLKKCVIEGVTDKIGNKEILIEAVVLIEDKRFYGHMGVDFFSVIRAFLKNIFYNRIEGASTITQQLVRVLTNNRKISLRRKVTEMLLAVLIESDFSKSEIIIAYLNLYRFYKVVGIEDFCQNENYEFSTLSISNSIEIAARFKYPHISQSNYIRYLKRVRTIEKKLMQTYEVVEAAYSINTEDLTSSSLNANRKVKNMEVRNFL